jgi:hypothetical protein
MLITALKSWRLRLILAVAILTVALSTGVAARQNGGGTSALLQQIVSSLTVLQQGVNSIVSSLDAVAQEVDGLSAANNSNVVFTPAVDFRHGRFACRAVNIADSARSIRAQIFSTQGIEFHDLEGLVEPGHALGIGATENAIQGDLFCKFTVGRGTKQDIRAAASIGADPVGFENTVLLGPAQ